MQELSPILPGSQDGHLTDEYLSLSFLLSVAPYASRLCVWSPGAHLLIDLGVASVRVALGCLLESAGSGHLVCWFCILFLPEEGIGEVLEKEDCMQALSGQIFMGMVSSQYQARLDIVRLIDGLVNACIRFVYFSLEDELKSKVGRDLPLCCH